MSSVMLRARRLSENGLIIEAVRQSIHLLVALVPVVASVSVNLAMSLVGVGTLFYVFAENARRSGLTIAVVSDLTLIASRDNESEQFVLGPVTLGLGAMLALTLYPLQASTIAIFALAFGDSVASLVGKSVVSPRLPFGSKKTLAGSATCFLVVLLVVYRLSADVTAAVVIALVTVVLEAFAPDDMDNVLIPVGTGLAASLLLP